MKFAPTSTELLARYRIWNCEELLNQAVDLLERCLSEYIVGIAQFDSAISRHSGKIERIRQTAKKKLADEANLLGRELDILTAEERFLNDINVNQDAHGGANWHANEAYQRAEAANNPVIHAQAGLEFHREAITNKRYLKDKDVIRSRVANATEEARILREEIDGIDGVMDLVENIEAPHSVVDTLFAKMSALVESDYKSAVERLTIASDGLSTIFGYPIAFTAPEGELIEIVLKCLEWARAAIAWRKSSNHFDESNVHLVLLSGKDIKRSADGKSDVFEFKISKSQIQAAHGVPIHTIRMVGVCVSFASTVTGTRLLTSIITAPTSALAIRRDGSTVGIDQTLLPALACGRIQSTDNKRPQEIVGASAWSNASPISEISGFTMIFPVGAVRSNDIFWFEIRYVASFEGVVI